MLYVWNLSIIITYTSRSGEFAWEIETDLCTSVANKKLDLEESV